MKKNLLTLIAFLFTFSSFSSFNASAQAIEPCVEVDECFEFRYLGPEVLLNGNVILTFTIQTNCQNDLSYAAFQLPIGGSAITPTNSYTKRFQYGVENPTNKPFRAIKFEALNANGYKNGVIDTFRYELSAATFASLTTIMVQAKAAGTVGTVTFNAIGCNPICNITANIAGPDTVCAYNDEAYTYTTPTQTNATYVWSVPADWTIDAGQGTNSLTVHAGIMPGNVTVTVTNTCGTASDIQPVAVNEECGMINPLPVDLVSFEGSANNEGVVLNWATATEKNNEGFEIERSNDGKSFEAIGKIAGKGNATSLNTYSFADLKATSGVNYYRLEQRDFDGTTSYSKVIAVSAKGQVMEMSVAPNPVTDGRFSVRMADNKTDAELMILDLSGRLVHKQLVKANSQQLDMNLNLKRGMYVVSLTAGNAVTTQKIVVQ